MVALPDRDIQAILKKFGPHIKAYLESVGYFDLEGPYEPTDVLDVRAMQSYLTASKAKNAEVWGVLEKYLLPEMAGKGEKFIEIYGLKPVINVEEIATDYIKTRGGQFIKKTTSTDKKRLVNYIWQNASKNERPLAKQILKEPGLSSIVAGHRAETIIRTERARAIRGGANLTAKEAGATAKTWHNVGDKRVRPSHRALGGTEIPIGDDFPGEGAYPGAVSINCRCWLEYGFTKKVADHPHPSMSALEELYGDVTPGQRAKVAEPVKPKVIEFVPANTLSEAREFAAKSGVKLTMDKSGQRLDIANHANEWIVKRTNAGKPIPAHIDISTKSFIKDGAIKLNTNASYSSARKRININPAAEMWYDPAKSRAESVKSGWHEPGSVLDHEMGHYLHHKEHSVTYRNLARDYRQPAGDVPKELRKDISRYGGTTILEFVAEMYNGMVNGKTYPEALMKAYKQYKGPTI